MLRIIQPEHQPLQTGGSRKDYKPPKEEETKRQRQNRKKAEERKIAREEDEKARRVLLEKQLRTARESRGEAARNGLAPAPSTSAWTNNGPQKAAVSAPINGANGTLLDTFVSENAPPSQPKMNGNGRQGGWAEHGLPSEEEQMRILAESDESAWKTVSKKEKKKRKNTNDSESNGGAVQPVDLTNVKDTNPSEITSKVQVEITNGVH